MNDKVVNEMTDKTNRRVHKEFRMLEEPIKELGEFPVKIKFGHNLEAEIKVIVTKEGEKLE